MAKFSHGIHGPFVGKVGTVVGSSWMGIPYMKAKTIRRTKRKGSHEGINQDKLSTVHAFLKPLLRFVRQGFKGYTETVQGYNAAKSYNLLHAFEGDQYEPKVLVAAKMLVSHGDLPLPTNIRVSVVDHTSLQFEWDIPERNYTADTDQVMLLAYDPASQNVNMKLLGQFRYTGTDTLELHDFDAGDSCHVYCAFVAGDRSRQSMSVYLGLMTV